MRTESEIKEMIHRIGNNPNLIGAGEKKALEWVLDVEGSAMSSNAVLAEVLSEIEKLEDWKDVKDLKFMAEKIKQEHFS